MNFDRRSESTHHEATLITQTSDENTQTDTLVELESHPSRSVSDSASAAIIRRVLISAMYDCAKNAIGRGDHHRAEFWLVELATAPPPAGPSDIAKGVNALCDQILFPARRFNEARIYLEHAASLDADTDALVAEAMLVTNLWALGEVPNQAYALAELKARALGLPQSAIDAELARAALILPLSSSHQLIDSDAWMTVDLGKAATGQMTRQDHYDRLLCRLFARNDQAEQANLRAMFQSDYLPAMIGFLNGVAPSLLATGSDRDVVARAIWTWYKLALRSDDQPTEQSAATTELQTEQHQANMSSQNGVLGYGVSGKKSSVAEEPNPPMAAPSRLGYHIGKKRT